jgi:hypothetical protein
LPTCSFGVSKEVAYVYLATGLDLGKTSRELTELMEMRLAPVEEAPRPARDKRRVAIEGEIGDGPTALALLWWEPLLRPEERKLQTHEPDRVVQAQQLDRAIFYPSKEVNEHGRIG